MPAARRVRLGSLAALVLCAAPLHAQRRRRPRSPPPRRRPPWRRASLRPRRSSLRPRRPWRSRRPPWRRPAPRQAPARGRSRPPTRAPAASDHDAVVGHVGIAARRFDPGPLPLALRAGFGCPADMTTPCDGDAGGARRPLLDERATSRSTAASRSAVGGGSRRRRRLSTPTSASGRSWASRCCSATGATWRSAPAPSWRVVWFRPAGGRHRQHDACSSCAPPSRRSCTSASSASPRCRSACTAGRGFQYESAPAARLWSVGVIGGGSVWGALSNLFVRYYL